MKVKRRLEKVLGVILCLGMIIGLMPIQALQIHAADETEHKHCVCGAAHKDIGDHTTETQITFTAWTSTDSLPDTAGNYYLVNNVKLSVPTDDSSDYRGWKVPDGIVLCLNGHSITAASKDLCNAIFINYNTTFTVTDCKNTGKITHDEKEDGTKYTGTAVNMNGGNFNMYGGTLIGNDATSDNDWDGKNCGGGVYIGQGIFKMYGGSITQNHAATKGGGVYIATQWNRCVFKMYGGSITDNTAEKEGGGVYAVDNITVSGNVNISGNKKADNSVSNVCLYTNSEGETKTIKIVGDIKGSIGVYTDRAVPTVDNSIVIAQGVKEGKDYSGIITSDNSNYKIIHNSSDYTKLVLASKDTPDPAPAEHKHCVCGTNDLDISDHTCNKNQIWTGVSDISEITSDGYYYLMNDVVLTSTSTYSNVYTGVTEYCGWKISDDVVLCLNGYNIIMQNPQDLKKYDGTNIDVDAIMVEGHLTLTDCQGEGKITHAKDSSGETCTGIGIEVQGGTFDMYAGTITGNTGGSGVCIEAVSDKSRASIFNMYGGAISGNTSNNGGGVMVSRIVYNGPSEFNMYGGSITNNISDSEWESYGNGGGVYVSWTAKFFMSGGEIRDNTANHDGGGIYGSALARNNAYDNGGTAQLKFSGDAIVTGNNVDGKDNNIYMTSSTGDTGFETLTVTLDITNSFKGIIGISTKNIPTANNPVPIVKGADPHVDYKSNIISDDERYNIQHDGNMLVLSIDKEHQHTWNNGEITKQPTTTAEGVMTYTCTGCGATRTEPIAKLASNEYQIIDGANGNHTIGQDGLLAFRSNAPFSEFIAVLVDGEKVDESNYELSEGSTIVRLKQSFLDTLSKGKHTIAIQSVGGTASTEFTVAETADHDTGNGSGTGSGVTTEQEGIKAPETGDASPISHLVLMLIIAGGFIILAAGFEKNRFVLKR